MSEFTEYEVQCILNLLGKYEFNNVIRLNDLENTMQPYVRSKDLELTENRVRVGNFELDGQIVAIDFQQNKQFTEEISKVLEQNPDVIEQFK